VGSWEVHFLANKKKEYEYAQLNANIRKTYFDFMKELDISITQFLDEALGDKIESYGKDDEYYIKEMQSCDRRKASFESLLKNKHKEEMENHLQEEKFRDQLKPVYSNFCVFMDGTPRNEAYNTKRVSDKFGINISSFKEYEQIEKSYKDGNFSIDDFRKLKEVK